LTVPFPVPADVDVIFALPEGAATHGQPGASVNANEPVPPLPGRLAELLDKIVLHSVEEEKLILAINPAE
jgi:hypothetical protein